MSTPKLFQPIKVGECDLAHRVVLAPLTRTRAKDSHLPSDQAAEYYAQRGSAPGTLLISEATYVSAHDAAGGRVSIPGIYTEEQVTGWRTIADAVHAKGSYLFMQIYVLGRAARRLENLEEQGFPYVSASDVQMSGRAKPPRPLTIPEIQEAVQQYARAAQNAIRAGVDGVELHGAHGYLIDQFLQDVSNKRTDAYGGSVENRARFGLEVVEAVTKAIGAKRTGIRISPWSRFQDMAMDDPKPTFAYFVRRLRELYPDLAYLHVVEPVVDAGTTRKNGVPEGQSNDFIREIWAPLPLISAGVYTRESGIQTADEKGDLIAYGRPFIANPDLPARLKHDIPLTPYDQETFYVQGPPGANGYTDYPFAAASASLVV
ncbi:hypothetical protein PLICRDRAFT_452974 [Plicaturopsis crispa FD-325 SS-3]|uniref:NADH:flavin oxidoreductase/NADH oxidase N-terminal domain-containing protein n=1 Tax=Plicaturopsis crispa FD-325 SS-3 TaxID=944288 RepID=A0A0C9T5A2_PLICR|nr:hypothetical protein PLICRDRAFT_452974 [Plicaturopsis crispa FD-325 SS-3]